MNQINTSRDKLKKIIIDISHFENDEIKNKQSIKQDI